MNVADTCIVLATLATRVNERLSPSFSPTILAGGPFPGKGIMVEGTMLVHALEDP